VIDSTKAHVITALAASNAEAVEKSALARRRLCLLIRHNIPLSTAENRQTTPWLLSAAWWVIDAAASSLDEIRIDAQPSVRA